jgi:hypothetical protein
MTPTPYVTFIVASWILWDESPLYVTIHRDGDKFGGLTGIGD